MPEYPEQVATSEYLDTIRRLLIKRMWIILLFIFIVSLSAFVTSLIIEPVYETSTSIRIQQQPFLLTATGRAIRGQKSLAPEALWLKSRFLIEEVMKKLGIGSTAKSQKDYFEVLKKLRDNIQVEVFEDSDTVKVTVHWNDPKLTMQIANTLADTFIERYQSFNRAEAKETRSYIEEQLNLVRLRLSESQQALNKFQKKEGVLSITREAAVVSDQLAKLQAEKYRIDTDLKFARLRLGQVKRRLNQQGKGSSGLQPFLTSNPLTDDSLVQHLRTQVATLETEIASLSSLYTDKFPQLIREKAELAETKKKLTQELSRLTSGAKIATDDPFYQDLTISSIQTQAKINALEEREKALTDLINESRFRAKDLPDKQITYLNLVREEKINEELYTLFLKKLSEARIREGSDTWDVRVFNRAYEPYAPIKPKPVRNTIFGAIIGLLLGISVSMVIEYFDDSFKTIAEVEQYLKLPVLAALPRLQNKPQRKKRKKRRKQPWIQKLWKSLRTRIKKA